MKGTIKFYNGEKGYGFIKSEPILESAEKIEYFFHIRDVENVKADEVPKFGQPVEFEPHINTKGKIALHVELI